MRAGAEHDANPGDTALGRVQVTTEPSEETMPAHGPNRDSRNANALAVVAGALIALIAVLAFLAVISHRGGAQEWPRVAGAKVGYAAPAGIEAQSSFS